MSKVVTESVVGVLNRFAAREEFARQPIQQEALHAAEVDKVLRKPGELEPFSKRHT